jgi:hypothetical protein
MIFYIEPVDILNLSEALQFTKQLLLLQLNPASMNLLHSADCMRSKEHYILTPQSPEAQLAI